MARIFLEINDTQRRVPASLRWDLDPLVNPTKDKYRTVAAQLVYELATRDGSPLLDRVDLTGEKSHPKLKQASIAPEIRTLVAKKNLPLRKLDFEGQYTAFHTYLSAIRSLDPDGCGRWNLGVLSGAHSESPSEALRRHPPTRQAASCWSDRSGLCRVLGEARYG